MKLYYIANIRLPTEKAHGIQIMKMCEAFASLDVETELIVPRRFNKIKNDPFNYYGVEKSFAIRKIFCLDLIALGLGKFGFLIENLSFSLSAFFYLFFKKRDFIYSRETLPLFFIADRKRSFLEIHNLPAHFFLYKRLLKKIGGIVAITEHLRKDIAAKGLMSENILTAPDGVDADFFKVEASKIEIREKLDLPLDKKIVLYAGHFYSWKGSQILAEASKYLGGEYLVVFVGGIEKDIMAFKNKNRGLKNLSVIGRKPYADIPYWLKAADILVLPNSAQKDISRFYTSPLKMFEYMASGSPIVASDIPSVREILNERNSFLFAPDNAESLASVIQKASSDFGASSRIAGRASFDVKNYSWQERAKKIINFIESKL